VGCWRQLGLLAKVVGIVLAAKPIQNLFYSKHKPLQYLWQMCSVTIAAQVLCQFAFYYFHQIPTLFLITEI
jgi:competence protein ComEC